MGKGYDRQSANEQSQVIDVRGAIVDRLMQRARSGINQGEDVTFFVIPGKWTVSEFRDLLAHAA